MKKISFFAILTSGLLFASCAGEEIPGYSDSDLNDTPPAVEEPAPDNDNPVTERIPIEFEIPASALTKTTIDLEGGVTVNWQDGDKVGIFYRYTPKDSETSTIATQACNVPYEYDAETGKFVAVDTPAYWDEGAEGTDHYLYVYYPYNGASTSYAAIAGKLAVEQTYDAAAAQNAVASYGCFTGRASKIKYGKPVSFNALYHQFAMTRLNFTNNTGKDIVISTAEITSSKSISGDIIIKMSSLNDYGVWPLASGGSGKTITVNVENGQVAAGRSIDIRFLQLTGNFASSDFTVKVTTTENEEYTFGYSGKGAVNGGQRIAKNINFVSPYAIKAVVDDGVLFKIDGDNTGGLVLFPAYRGLRGTQNDDGTYEITTDVGLINTSVIDVSDLSTASSTDGAVNVAILKEVDPTLENCPAVKVCEDLNSRIGGGWYLPAEEEWKTLLEVYNGTSWDDISTGKPNAITEDEKTARNEFESLLTSLKTVDDQTGDGVCESGQKINTMGESNNGREYWSSTWTSSSKGIVLRTGAIRTQSEAFTYENRVRCIKKVKF